MKRSRLLLLIFLAVVSIGAVIVDQTADRLLFDRYAGQPQVVGLPDGFDPLALAAPYAGPHPSQAVRRADPYPWPIPLGGTGPVVPTHLDELSYPYACRSEPSGLGQPIVDNMQRAGVAVYAEDEQGHKTDTIVGYSKDCSIPTRVLYYFLDKDSGEFRPYDDGVSDVAMVSVGGQDVPFVVRLEIGTINRHIYVIAMVRGPGDTTDVPDTSLWNGRLLYQFRGGVGIGRRQGRIEPFYIPDRRRAELARGYAVAYSTANQTSNHYDINLAEDTVARLKRHFAARYGTPRYTIGIGKSGGAIQQYLIAQNRPGLLDGGLAIYSYPDMITQTTKVMDCELLQYHFDVRDKANPSWQNWQHRGWVEGFNAVEDMPNAFERLEAVRSLFQGRWPEWSRGHTECTKSWRTLTPQIINPNYTYFASLFAPDVAAGVPWTYWDGLKQVFGTDPSGYARRTWDNIGVQYGLAALKTGRITIDEFLNLNAAIGGWKPARDMSPERYWRFAGGDSDLADMSIWSHHNMNERTSAEAPAPRSEGDVEAIRAAYRSGQVFIGRMTMPIIDMRHYLEPELDMHHSLQSFSARLRMLRGQGRADNQLVWMMRPPVNVTADALTTMERWLDKLAADPDASVASAKPLEAQDRCYGDDGELVATGEGVWDGVWNDRPDGRCMQVYPVYANPRIVAGDDYSGHIFKCYRRSVEAAVEAGLYAPVDMRPHRDRLARVFPDGVCDYERGDAGWPPELSEWRLAAKP